MKTYKKPAKHQLEGGTVEYWGDDINSEADDAWAAATRKLLDAKQGRLSNLISNLKNKQQRK